MTSNLAPQRASALQNLAELLTYAHEMGATDVHISTQEPPDVVVRGRLHRVDFPKPSMEDVTHWAQGICTPQEFAHLNGPVGAADGATNLGQLRIRCAFRRQEGGTALTVRLLPLRVPTFQELAVPQNIADFINYPNGLVIVSGPTGSGKSTLLASMVKAVSEQGGKHIMTIEDPIEYLHAAEPSSRISQREIGRDVATFGEALRSSLRARPNIVVVGEMRDQETARAALDAAAKGQLVLTTSHAGAVSEVVEGFLGMFPAEEQNVVSGRLASVFRAIVVQQLVPNLTDTDVVPIRELALRSDGIISQIRQRTPDRLYSALQNSGGYSLETNLVELVTNNHISVEIAKRYANNLDELLAYLGSQTQRRGGRK